MGSLNEYLPLISLVIAAWALFIAWTARRSARGHSVLDREQTAELVQEAEGDQRPEWSARYDDLQRGLLLETVREVHALREAKIRELQEENGSIRQSEYARIYRDTAFLTHNSSGPSSGPEKLLRAFLGEASTGGSEIPVLRRLGFNDDEIAKYVKEASEAEFYT